MRIIYDSYRTELSYGIERGILVTKLTEYFETKVPVDIQLDQEQLD